MKTLREDVLKLSGEQALNEDMHSMIETVLLTWVCGGSIIFGGTIIANKLIDWLKGKNTWNERYAPRNQKIVDKLATQVPDSQDGLLFAANLNSKSSESDFVISIASKLINKHTKDSKLDFTGLTKEYQDLLSERLAKTKNKMETDSDIKAIADNIKTINANLGLYFKISGLQARQLKQITLKLLKSYFKDCKINLNMVYKYSDWEHTVE